MTPETPDPRLRDLIADLGHVLRPAVVSLCHDKPPDAAPLAHALLAWVRRYGVGPADLDAMTALRAR
jgi:hypothetical protein